MPSRARWISLLAALGFAGDAVPAPAASWTVGLGDPGAAVNAQAGEYDVVVTAQQRTWVAWWDPGALKVMASQRPAGGSFAPPVTVASAVQSLFGGLAVVAAGEDLEVVFRIDAESSFRVARLAPGASDPTVLAPVSAPGGSPPRLAQGPDGTNYLSWAEGGAVKVRHQAPGGTSFVATGPFDDDMPPADPNGVTVTDLAASPTGGSIAACWTSESSTGASAECARNDGVAAPLTVALDSAAAGYTLNTVRVAYDASGNAAFASSIIHPSTTPFGRIRAAVLAAGSSTPTPTTLVDAADAKPAVGPLDVAYAPDGTAVLAWSQSSDGTVFDVAAATLTGQTATSLPAVQAGTDPVHGLFVERFSSRSATGVAVTYDYGGPNTVRSALRVGTGSFSSPQLLAAASDAPAAGLRVHEAPAGEGIAIWASGPLDSPPVPIRLAALDTTPPSLLSSSIPSAGTPGAPLRFEASGSDAWSPPVTALWGFGDATGTFSGSPVEHTFGAAGTYPVTLTLRDGAGNERVSPPVQTAIASAPSPPGAPPPPPSGPTPVPYPLAGKRGNVLPVSGTVRVKFPGTTRFVRIETLTSIPVGTIIDARHGTVRLTVSDGRGGTYTGLFSGGVFRFTQARRPLPRLSARRATATGAALRRRRVLITDLALVAGSFRLCPRRTAKRASLPAQAAKRRVVRYLQARARGRFNVIGRRASGIERGTAWRTTDTCDATEVRVTQGAVLVTDRVRRRTVLVRKGRTYVARAPVRPRR